MEYWFSFVLFIYFHLVFPGAGIKVHNLAGSTDGLRSRLWRVNTIHIIDSAVSQTQTSGPMMRAVKQLIINKDIVILVMWHI